MSIGIIQDQMVIDQQIVYEKKKRRIEALKKYLEINSYNQEYLKRKGFDKSLIYLREKEMAYKEELKKLEQEL